MKNDRNDRYYGIMSQTIPNDYEGDVLGPKKKISEELKAIVNILNYKVKDSNKTHLNNVGEFNFSQHLTNLDEEIIIIINYSNKLIQINIPEFNNNIVFNYISFFIKLQRLIPENSFKEFQNILQKFKYRIKSNNSYLLY
jgi:hypothetical protein